MISIMIKSLPPSHALLGANGNKIFRIKTATQNGVIFPLWGIIPSTAAHTIGGYVRRKMASRSGSYEVICIFTLT